MLLNACSAHWNRKSTVHCVNANNAYWAGHPDTIEIKYNAKSDVIFFAFTDKILKQTQ